MDVLKRADEEVWVKSELSLPYRRNMFMSLDCSDNTWMQKSYSVKTVITLDQLEELLLPNYVVKDVHLTIEELKEQAEKLGFELIEKKREIKVGDFGGFWENLSNVLAFGFIKKIEEHKKVDENTKKEENSFFDNTDTRWKNFRHLTDEEKEKIQNNW